MKVLIIGGYGTIGQKVAEEISQRHEVITAGRNSGDVTVDITSSQSIEELFKRVPNLDACACIAGEVHWADFDKMTEEEYYIGIRSKADNFGQKRTGNCAQIKFCESCVSEVMTRSHHLTNTRFATPIILDHPPES
jgi:nucleoside-diphosphate-sugar epimerase